VIQRGRGKGGTDHIRVTNIREKKVQTIPNTSEFFSNYREIVKNYLKTGKRPRSIEIQRTLNCIIFELNKNKKNYSVADFDDGLIHIGLNFCQNHENPKCDDCPINEICRGFTENAELIENYRT